MSWKPCSISFCSGRWGVFGERKGKVKEEKERRGGQGVTKAYQGDYFRTSFHGRPHNNARKKKLSKIVPFHAKVNTKHAQQKRTTLD